MKEEHSFRVFENRVLRKISGTKREEVVAGWRTLHNEEPRNFYASPNVIKIMKSREMRWAGQVARIGELRNAYNILIVKPERKRHSEELGVHRKIILE
jgi:hypothetical protein